MTSNEDINIQVIEKLNKLDKRVTLISDNTKETFKQHMCEFYECDEDKNPILNDDNEATSRIDNLEIAVDELRSGERSRFSRRRNRRHVVAEGGRRTRGKLRAKSRAKSRKKRRRKRGGTRKNGFPEKPIVGYNYRINIYWPVGEGGPYTELRYGDVIGTYLGLAEEFHDGFQGEDKKKLMFRTPHITDEDGPRELIGEIISKIGPSTINIHTQRGGKKRTKKRRKSRRKKRRKSRRKKRTKRRKRKR